MKDWSKEVLEVLKDSIGIAALYGVNAKAGDIQRLTNQALAEITKATLAVVPEKKIRKTDTEYGYCITCNQIIDDAEADCFCTIHNLAVDNFLDALGVKDD